MTRISEACLVKQGVPRKEAQGRAWPWQGPRYRVFGFVLLTRGRRTFEEFVEEADVVIDGYRPGSLDRRSYGPEGLARRAIKRGKGYV